MAGSIQERTPGVFRVRVSAGHDKITGQRRVIRKTVRGTRQDADMAVARILVDIGDGKDLGTNATVADFLGAWLPQKTLAPSTADDWERVVRLHILPRLGHLPMRKLTVFKIDQFYADLATAGVSPTRIAKVHTVLRVAMARAVKWQWIAANPCTDADRPTIPTGEATAPDPATVRRLFELAEARSLRLLVMIRLAAALGCRRGELCGLQWDDIDLAAATVHVRRTVGVVRTGPYIKPYPKNEKRRGAVPVHADVLRTLQRWRLHTAKQRLADGEPWLFTAPDLGGFYRPNVLSHEFRTICNTAGIPSDVKLHGLRHFVGTRLRDDGTDHDVISRHLGHARTSTTIDIYGHAVDGRARQAADAIERIIQGG